MAVRRARPRCARWVVLPLALHVAGAWAQESGRGFWLQSGASLTQTVTDNFRLSSDNTRTEGITQVNANLRAAAQTGRVRGSLDYTLSGVVHDRASDPNTTQNLLAASGQAELIERWAFLDAAASITQQSISAFGQQAPDPTLGNNNRTEVRSLRLAPSVRGRIGEWATYSGQFGYSQTSAAKSQAGDSKTRDAAIALGAGPGFAKLGWGLNLTHQQQAYHDGRDTTVDAARASLSYRVLSDLRVSASGGREWSDVVGTDRRSTGTWGLGTQWTPTERTQVSAQYDHRFFGDAHAVSVSHRMARSVWTFSSSRDLNDSGQQLVRGASVDAYGLFDAMLTSTEPDATKRRQLVLALLQQYGLSPTSAVATGFLTSAVTLTERQSLAVALQGARSSLSVSAFNSLSRRIDPVVSVADDLANAARVHQFGYSINIGHRLTPQTGGSITVNWQHTSGSTDQQTSELRSALLSLTTATGPRSSLSLSVRHVEYISIVKPYIENAVIGSLGIRF